MDSWLSLPNVLDHASRAADYVAEQHRKATLESYSSGWHCVGRKSVQSPIEAIFSIWWTAHRNIEDNLNAPFDFASSRIPIALRLRPQKEVVCAEKNYRIDFEVTPDDADGWEILQEASILKLPIYKIAIELDGHEFHERTREQVVYRDQRDRDFTKEGWKLFHFSGSEVVADPLKCVLEVYEYAAQAYYDLSNRVRVYVLTQNPAQ